VQFIRIDAGFARFVSMLFVMKAGLPDMCRREKLERMLIANPGDVFLLYGLAMELVKEGNHEEALARFDQLIAADPCYVAAYHHKANTLIARGRLSEAREVLETGKRQARSIGDEHAYREMTELQDGIIG